MTLSMGVSLVWILLIWDPLIRVIGSLRQTEGGSLFGSKMAGQRRAVVGARTQNNTRIDFNVNIDGIVSVSTPE